MARYSAIPYNFVLFEANIGDKLTHGYYYMHAVRRGRSVTAAVFS